MSFRIPSYEELVQSLKLSSNEPNWEELHPYLSPIGQSSTPVQNSQPRIISQESEKQNPATVIFGRIVNPPPVSAPPLEQIHHTQRKRPAEPLVSAQRNKRQRYDKQLQLQLQLIDPRARLLKERRTQLGINRTELRRRVNDYLIKTFSTPRLLTPLMLPRIEGNKAPKETIDAYYDHINTILDRASNLDRSPEALPAERSPQPEYLPRALLDIAEPLVSLNEAPESLPVKMDPRPAYLKMLRTNAGLTTDELSKKLRTSSGIKLPGAYLVKIEGGSLNKDIVDEYYTDIKNFLEAFMCEQSDYDTEI
jgi:hypothetical protein